MTAWLAGDGPLPSKAGWYPTLSNWGTKSLHPGAKRWLGKKWATSVPDRIAFFSSEPFDCPHAAAAKAFSLEGSPLPAPTSAIDDAACGEPVSRAAAAG